MKRWFVQILLGAMIMLVSVIAQAAPNVLEVEGHCAVSPYAATIAQGKLLARRGAIMDAYRSLAEYTAGVQVNSESKVADLMSVNDLVKTRVSAVIKGAKIIGEEYYDGDYKVTLQLPLFGEGNSLAEAIFGTDNSAPQAFPLPEFSTGSSTGKKTEDNTGSAATINQRTGIIVQGNFTGVIIDCRGLGLQTAMSPVIKVETGAPVYGYKNLDKKFIIKHGMAGYTADVENAARAGTKPLVIKAVSIDGFCNPVISCKDADIMLTENRSAHFLERCAVVFVK